MPGKSVYSERVEDDQQSQLNKLNYGLSFLKLILAKLHEDLRQANCSLKAAQRQLQEMACISLPTVCLLHRTEPPHFSILD